MVNDDCVKTVCTNHISFSQKWTPTGNKSMVEVPFSEGVHGESVRMCGTPHRDGNTVENQAGKVFGWKARWCDINKEQMHCYKILLNFRKIQILYKMS